MSLNVEQIEAKLLELCSGNTDAVNFINRFWRMCIVWDDAVDYDKTGGEDEVNDAFMWALFGINDDPFYRIYQPTLRPAIMLCVANWMTANKFEKSRQHCLLEQAYVLRCSPYDVFATVALICGGFGKMRETVEFLRSFAPEDTFRDYLAEHKE